MDVHKLLTPDLLHQVCHRSQFSTYLFPTLYLLFTPIPPHNARQHKQDAIHTGGEGSWNQWKHPGNIEGTGSICPQCNCQTHVRCICDVICTCYPHVTTNPRLITFQMCFPIFPILSLTHNQPSHLGPNPKILTTYPPITCGLHLMGTFGMCTECIHHT